MKTTETHPIFPVKISFTERNYDPAWFKRISKKFNREINQMIFDESKTTIEDLPSPLWEFGESPSDALSISSRNVIEAVCNVVSDNEERKVANKRYEIDIAALEHVKDMITRLQLKALVFDRYNTDSGYISGLTNKTPAALKKELAELAKKFKKSQVELNAMKQG